MFATAALTPDGTLGLVYVPNAASTITMDLSKMAGPVVADWYDPTTASSITHTSCTIVSPCPATSGKTFPLATANGEGTHDWVLRLTAP